MRNLYGMIALALFSTVSTNAMAAEPIECSSPNHNSCFSFEPEEIPTIIDLDAFYGAFTDLDGRIRIPDLGEFDLSPDIQCAAGGASNAAGDHA